MSSMRHIIDLLKKTRDKFLDQKNFKTVADIDNAIDVVQRYLSCDENEKDYFTFTPSSGIGQITKERAEQIFKHHRTIKNDAVENSNGQLSQGALMLLNVDYAYEEGKGSEPYPKGWDHDLCLKMINKSYKERLIIAGALLAAELDRLKFERK